VKRQIHQFPGPANIAHEANQRESRSISAARTVAIACRHGCGRFRSVVVGIDGYELSIRTQRDTAEASVDSGEGKGEDGKDGQEEDGAKRHVDECGLG